MNFSTALSMLRAGAMVARTGWNGKGMFLKVQYPDSGSANTLPYIWIKTADGHRVPWLASQTDLLSDDWVEVRERTVMEQVHSKGNLTDRYSQQSADESNRPACR